MLTCINICISCWPPAKEEFDRSSKNANVKSSSSYGVKTIFGSKCVFPWLCQMWATNNQNLLTAELICMIIYISFSVQGQSWLGWRCHNPWSCIKFVTVMSPETLLYGTSMGVGGYLIISSDKPTWIHLHMCGVWPASSLKWAYMIMHLFCCSQQNRWFGCPRQ